MSIFHNDMLAGAGGQGGGGSSYQISRSLRFNSASSKYLSRTPSVAGNRKTWTWAGWVKRSVLGDSNGQVLFSSGSQTSPINIGAIEHSPDYIRIYNYTSGTINFDTYTTAVYRDTSAWYHVVVSVDTTLSTAADRVIVYVNGSRQARDTSNPAQNLDTQTNAAQIHYIGAYVSGRYLSAYLADVHFIDGQALTPSSFGQLDANGVWQPIAYTGGFGTNGFRLDFSDNSTATSTGIGKDASGNGNNWTPTNFSVTAGAGNDSLVDSPTNYGTDTGAGGEVRGNYCTLNPLSGLPASRTLSNGSLDIVTSTGSGSFGTTLGTIAVNTGKWYWEYTCVAYSSVSDFVFGIAPPGYTQQPYQGDSYVYFGYDGNKANQGTSSAYGSSYTNGDIIGVAFNADSGSITFYKNGVSQGVAFTGISGTYAPLVGDTGSAGITASTNFGQRPFAYAAPSGFKALCSQNLPTPTIPNGRTAMDVVTYTGNGGTQTISGLSFSPDLVWLKARSAAYSHSLFDAVRGAGINLLTNSTNAEFNGGTSSGGELIAFNSDGFNLGSCSNSGTNNVNNPNGTTFVAWAWDAGTSTVTNTAGTITSQVRANASAGISIVSYTGNGSSGATVGHGLGVAPPIVIAKSRNNVDSWVVYTNLVDGSSDYLLLNTTGAKVDSSHSAPTSTVFNPAITVGPSVNCIAYCFAPVSGFSAFGSYTGNGSADGPFVFTQHSPRWILIKRTDSSPYVWVVFDTARDTYNVGVKELYPNTADAEYTATADIDILSNGFKIRSTSTGLNASGGTYIFASFASNPFSIARAR